MQTPQALRPKRLTIKYEGCCTDCRVWTASVTCDILEQKESRVALKKRLYQVNKIKTKITILDVEREDRFGPLFLRLFFCNLAFFAVSWARWRARIFVFFEILCMWKVILDFALWKVSAGPVQTPGKSQDIVSGDVIVKAEGL